MYSLLKIMTTTSRDVYLTNGHSWMPEMSSCALLFVSQHADTPFEKYLEIMMWAILILMPLLLDEGLEFRKEFLDRAEVRRAQRQVQELNACVSIHLLDSLVFIVVRYAATTGRLGQPRNEKKSLCNLLLGNPRSWTLRKFKVPGENL